nr:MAG TPA: hypothetical protein [Caudoviricetes sp.]
MDLLKVIAFLKQKNDMHNNIAIVNKRTIMFNIITPLLIIINQISEFLYFTIKFLLSTFLILHFFSFFFICIYFNLN